jgi:hypothetical protein
MVKGEIKKTKLEMANPIESNHKKKIKLRKHQL